MESLAKNKILVGILFSFILVMFLYNTFIKKDALSSETDSQSALVAGADLLKLSEDLSNAQLSQTLFSKSTYLFLTDFSEPIPQQPLGRSNPFNTIGRD